MNLKQTLKLTILATLLMTAGELMAAKPKLEGIQDDQTIEAYRIYGEGDQKFVGEHENHILKIFRKSKKSGKQYVTQCNMSKNSLRDLVGSTRIFKCGSLDGLTVE